MPGGILQNIADHPAGLVVATMDGVDEHRTLVRRRTPLPHDSPDLLHVAVANDHQMGSFTISFGHGNAQTQLTCCLEEATLLLDLRRQLLSVTAGRGPESRLRRLRSGLKLGWSFGGGTVINMAKAASGSLPSDPGLAGTIANFYAAIDGTERLLADQRTTTGVISLLEGVWTDVASFRTP